MKYKIFIILIFLQAAVIFLLIFDGIRVVKSSQPEIAANRRAVRYFMFTDLAIWSEARYTRHPSQTDLFSPFQDFPGATEHFPSGSIIAPPETLNTQRLEQ